MPTSFPGRAESEVAAAVRQRRSVITQVAVLSAVLNILMLSGSFFMLLVYDEVLPSRSAETLVGLLLMIVTAYGFQLAIDVIRGRAMMKIATAIDQRLSARVFDVLSRHDLRHGALPDGLQPVRDLDQIRGFLAGPGPLGLLDLPWVLLFLGILFVFHYALGLLATVGALILVVLTILTSRLTAAPTRRATELAGARFALASASQRNAEVLYALGMTGRTRAKWVDTSDTHLDAQDRLANVSGVMFSVSKTFRMLLQSMMLALGAALVINDSASGGIIIAGSILSARALAPIEQVIGNWRGLAAARQAWTRLDLLLARVPPLRSFAGLPAPQRSLSVEALTVTPPSVQRLTVADVSFELAAGDVLGVIGPSGSGKSSLLRALLGIWPPLRGSVRLDGATLDQWPLDDLGRHIGFMPQDVELFDGTVAQNISRFDPDADQAAILAAARAADIHDLIVRLPEGYLSPLGANGSSLSAGQRQRVALARALYRDPFLIVLDEPNSNLDRPGEIALCNAIATAAQRGAIVILVAHRPSALSEVTRLLYIADGRARAFGPRDEVLAKLNAQLPAPLAATETEPLAANA